MLLTFNSVSRFSADMVCELYGVTGISACCFFMRIDLSYEPIMTSSLKRTIHSIIKPNRVMDPASEFIFSQPRQSESSTPGGLGLVEMV